MRRHLSISQKIFIVFGIVVILSAISFLHLLNKTYEKSLISQGRSIAQQIVIFRKWAADFGGVWTKGKYTPQTGYLMKFTAEKGEITPYKKKDVLGEKEKVEFFLHNPALATRELSLLSKEEYGWTFKVVSDRYMAPQDKPDQWELQAIQKIKTAKKEEKKAHDEFWGWGKEKFRFAKAIYVKKGCLKCHGPIEQIAPEIKKALKAKYGENYKRAVNYKVGELRGLISVKIKPRSILLTAITMIDIWNILALILAFLIFWLFAKSEIIRPVEKLTKAAHDISVGKMEVDLQVRGLQEDKVRDEITKLAIAIDRLKTSIQLAMERLKKKKKKD